MQLFGRQTIYAAVDEVTAFNVVEVIRTTAAEHERNRTEIEYLYNYYRGKQPILFREKTIRPEICNRIVENRANEIVSFKVGYLCGEPIQYVSRSSKTRTGKNIAKLNDAMLVEGKAAKDKELAEWMHIAGVGYRIILPAERGSESPFEIYTLDPRSAYVIRSRKIGNKVLAGVHCGVDLDGKNVYSVYTPHEFFEIKDGEIVTAKAHILGFSPIIEYPLNRAKLGAFEPVLPLLDAINTVASNRLDGVEQFIQSLVKFINCEIDSEVFKELQALGAIQIKSVDGAAADVEIMSQELNQQQTQVLVDYLYQTVLTITGMPNRNGGSSTSDTGAAVQMRDGYTSANLRAQDTETMFKQSEQETLKVALNICKSSDESDIDLALKDIDIKFTRRNYENIQTKAQVLCEMLNNPKIDPKLAFIHCGMFTDAEEAYSMSMKYYDGVQANMVETGAETPSDEQTVKS